MEDGPGTPLARVRDIDVERADELAQREFEQSLHRLQIDELELGGEITGQPNDSNGDEPQSPSTPFEFGSGFMTPRPAPKAGIRLQTESTRPRAEEINAGSRLVPRIEDAGSDYMGLALELEAWFSLCDVSDVKKWLLSSDSLGPLFHGPFSTVPQATETVLSRLNDVIPPLGETLEEHTLLFLHLCKRIESHDPHPTEINSDVIVNLVHQVAGMRWMVDEVGEELARLLVLTRLALLAELGGTAELQAAHAQVYKSYGLDLPENEDYASPANYAAFMEEIERRYPAYIHPTDVNQRLGKRMRRAKSEPEVGTEEINDPADLVNNSRVVMPYVPDSIVEACHLFREHVKATPAVLQLYSEITASSSEPMHTSSSDEKLSTPTELDDLEWLQAIKSIYRSTLDVQKSFSRVVVDFVDNKDPGYATHGALAAVSLLLRWFDAAHICMFENLAAILFDSHFHFVAHVFYQKHPKVLTCILAAISARSAVWEPLLGEYVDGPALQWPHDAAELTINDCNKFALQSYTHLMAIWRLMVVGKTQRLLVAAELPVEPLKELFTIYEPKLWSEVLQLLKAEVQFTGKRWRYLNIELISAIYLYCPSRIDDNWLSGQDVTQLVRNAPYDEQELRLIVERYNERL